MPSAIEKLQKYLKLEAERGFDNKAIVGGLDKVLPAWLPEARLAGLDEQFVAYIDGALNQYPLMEPERRAEIVREISERIKSTSPAAPRTFEIPRPERMPERQPAPRPTPPPQPVYQAPQPVVRPEPVREVPRPVQQARSLPAIPLDSPITVVSGVGHKTAEMLANLGVNDLEDLLYFFPRRYDDYSNMKPINRLEYGEQLTLIATVKSSGVRPFRGRSQITEAIVTDGTGSLRLTWFNNAYIVKELAPGTQVVISGKVDMYLGRLMMNNPQVEALDEEHLHTSRIVPVYPLTEGLRQKRLREILYHAVTYLAPRVPDYIPAEIRSSAGLVDLSTALAQIHFPDSMEQLRAAQARLAFDEIFLLQLGVVRQKSSWQALSAQPFTVSDEWLAARLETLPFELTNAQKRALNELRADLQSGHPMNRLIQGDVGSGKTIIAALAAAIVVANGAQAAIMAPTSILAEQHFRTFTRLLTQEDGESAFRTDEIRLLVGDTSETEKQEIRAGLENGSVKIIIGTHALIEDTVVFQRLQLAVIDEQHRFGVEQRQALRTKGENPHLLVMTATPIPRSLALTLFGDLDLTVMDEMPVGRLPVETHVMRPRERERAYQMIRAQINQGRQAFVVYPLVEQSDSEENAGKSAVEEHARLQKEVFPRMALGLLHGRMKPEEKDQVMSRFRAGEYQLLVSTTVIEVGVDVPNASLMLIESANRFGLAQLHQLRGRVGRGSEQSYCLLIPENEDAAENERLAVMAETNDGFVLAERDLEQRGPGDFLGTRQAGLPTLHMASLSNVHLIEKARNLALSFYQSEPNLSSPEIQPLMERLDRFWGDARGDIS